jgi:hypothetical protein
VKLKAAQSRTVLQNLAKARAGEPGISLAVVLSRSPDFDPARPSTTPGDFSHPILPSRSKNECGVAGESAAECERLSSSKHVPFAQFMPDIPNKCEQARISSPFFALATPQFRTETNRNEWMRMEALA